MGNTLSAARLRDESGFSLAELVVVTGVLLVVTVPLLLSLTSAQRAERDAERLSRGTAVARVALDAVAREVRGADGLVLTGPDEATAWFDANGDGVLDPGELVVYAIRPDGGAFVLVRESASGTRILAADLTPSSRIEVTPATAGPVLRVALAVAVDGAAHPAPARLETEVLVRNG